jgi:hypothetical protein
MLKRAKEVVSREWYKLCKRNDGLLDLQNAQPAVKFVLDNLGGGMVLTDKAYA